MVNSKQFSKRLEKIMSYYDLSAASFADKIQVGRSSISHILSGRNKPSLEFVMKVVQSFPEVELYWILNGKGIFPKNEMAPPTLPKTENEVVKKENGQKFGEEITPNEEEKKALSKQNTTTSTKKKISRIVIFYEDGSFEAFQN